MRLKNMMDIETHIYVTDLEQITDSDFNYFSKTFENMRILDHELVFNHEQFAVRI